MRRLAAISALGALLALASLPAAASAEVPPPFWTKCLEGSAGGQCMLPRGVAADPNPPGYLYVADQGNRRINKFSAWGEFMETWGWDVVASGPGDDTIAPEDQFEICVPANGDVCKGGITGSRIGQFGPLMGLAIDGNGDIYAVDYNNSRVQKFDSEGDFLLMFGGGVNQGPNHPGNLCTAQHTVEGDTCGVGTQGSPGPGEGQFGPWPVSSFIAVGPANTVYVGDQERIQIFNSDGTFKSQIGLPGKGFVSALAVAPSGNIFVSFVASAQFLEPKPDVLKLDPTGAATLCTIKVPEPTAIALGSGENAYVVGQSINPTISSTSYVIRQFDASCGDREEAFGEINPGFGAASRSTGIAISTACNNGVSVYVSSFTSSVLSGENFFRAFGQRPDSDVCPPPIKSPTIEAQYALSVKTDSAVVGAEINPYFWGDTTYFVEYGTEECSQSACTQQPLAPGLTLKGAADADEALTAPGTVLDGLQPDTKYHYRFVAESGGGGPVLGEEQTFKTFPLPSPTKTDCQNQGFRGGASAYLSDCRAFEMVSPVDKNNGDITVLTRPVAPRFPMTLEQSSQDGNKVAYSSATAFGDALSAPYTSQYIATRKAGQAWSTHGISPPRQSKSISSDGIIKLSSEYRAFSADLCQAWLQHDTDPVLAPGAAEGFLNLYARDNCGAGADSYEALTTTEPPTASPAQYRTELQGISNDGAHAFFVATDKLTEDAAEVPGGQSLFPQLYESSGGALHYVCILPDGTPSGKKCTAGTLNGNPGGGLDNSVARAVSEDGLRVFWTSFDGNFGPGALYLRQNPGSEQSAIEGGECTEPEKACTIEVSAAPAQFWTAAVDGSKAIYTVGDELRFFDVEAREATSIAKGVIGVAEASEDASRVYFASTAALSEEPNSEGDKAEAGEPNLYFYREGEEGEEGSVEFIAELSGADVTTAFTSPLTASISVVPVSRAVRVSPDGQTLAFTSSASPTGYDNRDAETGKANAEVYLYEAGTDKLVCVSCNPTEARPHGHVSELDGQAFNTSWAARVPTWQNQLYAPRALSEDGSNLFFESYDALVPRDSNGAKDVYQWLRADSESDCKSTGAELYVESSDGCLSLISSGQSPIDSEFADASPDGKDVFIRTASSLVSWDPGLIDLYDARQGGGLPPPPVPLPPCDGGSCQSPSSAPNDPTPASASFRGAGNQGKRKPLPMLCRKGKRKVRRGGKTRCVQPIHRKRHNNRERARQGYGG